MLLTLRKLADGLIGLSAALGAIGGVGSRFIYPEIVPDELAKALLRVIEREAGRDT